MTDGKKVTVSEVIAEIEKASAYFSQGGGVTVSGGEALMQPMFIKALFEECKKRGWHTCLDSSGAYLTELQKQVLDITDLVLLDIKTMNPKKHEEYINWELEKVLKFAKYLQTNEIKMWVRHVLVPGWTDDEHELLELGMFVNTLTNVDRFEILPFHKMGQHKWEERGVCDPLADTPGATQQDVKRAKEILRSTGATVYA